MAGGLPRAVATCLYVGLLPVGSGTVASAAAIPLAWLLHRAGGFPLLLAATLLAVAAGFWAVSREIESRADGRPDGIVIDAVAGMWIALWPLSAGLWWIGAPPHLWPWPGWVGAFLLFRFLAIVRPWPVAWGNRQPGATGIMLDDLLAGLLTACAVLLAASLAHGWLG
jgi:phosphatidylglycerophosphatase A